MGNLIGIDSHKKQQIEDIAQEFLQEFTLAYNTAYGVEYTKLTLKEIDAESFAEEKPAYQLMQRSWDSIKNPLKMGYLTKKGAVVKNWKRRYFVVNPDYSVDYFENEEAYEKGFKPKGTIFPCGYEVNGNLDETMAERVKNLAKQMKVDEKEIGTPEKYPEHTFEVSHSRRRSYLITAENDEDKHAWIEAFKVCCRKAEGLKSEDAVGRAAFKVALWKTYWRYRVEGTEEQVLSDILVDRINYRVMSDVYAEIRGGWTMKQKIREQVVKTLDSLVMAMVIPSWKGMQESSQQMKTALEPTIKDKKDELAAVQRKVMWDLSELLKSTVEKVLKDMEETMKEMSNLLRTRMEQGLAELRKIFIKKIDEVIEKAKNTNEIEASLPSFFQTLDRAPRSLSVLYDALVCIRFVSALHEKFHERINKLNGHLVTDIGSDKLAQLLDSAMFTFEERLNEGISGTDAKANGETAADIMKVVKEEVLLKYDEDQKVVLEEYLMESMLCMLVPHTHSFTDEVCKPMIKPVESSIPDPLRQAISLNDKYDTYVETSLRDTIKKVCGIGGSPVAQPSGEPTTEEEKTVEPKADEQAKDNDKTSTEQPQAEEKAGEKPDETANGNSVEVEEKPSEGDEKQNELEDKSSKADEKPSEDEGKPSEAEGKPSEDEGKPREAEGKPSEDEGKPNEAEEKPNEDEGKPSEDEGRPNEAEEKPIEAEVKTEEPETEKCELTTEL
ncbi:PH domain-containing protein DDB_G0267786-like [Pocillopora damicornis]|uniref:PH domain-containing protein DDB_G0267786-like n=1 Tax=Pocillopora damicornis TaxID=46731 RepID=UPI000F5546D8|nr:PH domain-containing protein DDB_G0267786-like [Pocillopora damicornis]